MRLRCIAASAVLVLLALPCLLLLPVPGHAQSINIDIGAAGQAGATSRIIQLTALVTVLSLAPSLLVMMTAFTRIVIVLSLLRSALSTQGTPPNVVLIGLAMFLTYFVMQPVLEQAWTNGLQPMTEGRIGEIEGLKLATEPFHQFMTQNVRDEDLRFFTDLAHLPPGPGCCRRSLARTGPGVPGRRAAPRVRNGVSAVSAVPGDRHGGGQRAHEPRHDDVAAIGGFVAVQADLLRAGRRLAAGRGQPGAELLRLTRFQPCRKYSTPAPPFAGRLFCDTIGAGISST